MFFQYIPNKLRKPIAKARLDPCTQNEKKALKMGEKKLFPRFHSEGR